MTFLVKPKTCDSVSRPKLLPLLHETLTESKIHMIRVLIRDKYTKRKNTKSSKRRHHNKPKYKTRGCQQCFLYISQGNQ